MTITKYLHSCLLVEHEGIFLIDPGDYTYQARLLKNTEFQHIDYILITHEHADHFSLAFVEEIKELSPGVIIISTPSVVAKLNEKGIQATTQGNDIVHVENIPHEEILFYPVPENLKFTLSNKLIHPGDSLQFTTATEIIAMPMTAPWGSMVGALKKIIELKPKIVIPIHDWHWKDEALEGFYPRVADFLKPHGIEFKQLHTGVPITL